MDQENRFPVRKNPRLKCYDYTSCNYYFVTICTCGKQPLFGEPEHLSTFGRIAEECLAEVPTHFAQAHIDKWVVMPNHVHAIVVLSGGVDLSTVVGQYKGAVTRRIHSVQPELTVWQTSFHDHVIRDQRDYERIWVYIDTNPIRWEKDCFYLPKDTK